MKGQIKKHLHDGEEITCISVPSWFKYWHSVIFFPLIFPLLWAGLHKYSTHLVITPQRVLVRYGIISDHSKSVSFANLTTVKVHQSVKGRIFNYGYLHVHTNTGGQADLSFHYLKDPIRIKKEIEKGIARQNEHKKLEDHSSGGNNIGMPPLTL